MRELTSTGTALSLKFFGHLNKHIHILLLGQIPRNRYRHGNDLLERPRSVGMTRVRARRCGPLELAPSTAGNGSELQAMGFGRPGWGSPTCVR
jgi:hypothetical protein